MNEQAIGGDYWCETCQEMVDGSTIHVCKPNQLRADLTVAREERDEARAEAKALKPLTNASHLYACPAALSQLRTDRDRLAAELEDKLREEAEMKPHYAAMEYECKRLAAELKKAKEILTTYRELAYLIVPSADGCAGGRDRLRLALVQLDQSKHEAAAMREALETMSRKRACIIFADTAEHVADFFKPCDAALSSPPIVA